MLAERLLCLAPDARYADVMELCCNYHNLLRQFLPSSPIPSHPLTVCPNLAAFTLVC